MGYVAGTAAPEVVGPFSHREQIGTDCTAPSFSGRTEFHQAELTITTFTR